MRVRSRHNSKKKYLYRVILGLFFLVVIGLLVPKILTTVGQIALSPVYAVQNWFRESTDTLPAFLREKNDLLSEIESLESKLAVAESTDSTQQRLYEENIWLRELLNAEAEERIAAAVIARPNQLPYDFLQIDRGKDENVVVGAPVYVGIDNVIGVVVHTSNDFSFVELFTTPGFEATAYVSGSDVIATLEGYGGGAARVRVPQDVPLTIGSVVHIPSIQPGVFGRIEYIESTPTQPEQYGYITMRKPIAHINYVSVGVKPLTPPTAELLREEVNSIFEQTLLVPGVNTNVSSSTGTSTPTI